MEDRNEAETLEHHHDGIWIGIDLGTSNSACAVWDSSRGGSKWCVTNNVPRHGIFLPTKPFNIEQF
jgi:hypothetical protein